MWSGLSRVGYRGKNSRLFYFFQMRSVYSSVRVYRRDSEKRAMYFMIFFRGDECTVYYFNYIWLCIICFGLLVQMLRNCAYMYAL